MTNNLVARTDITISAPSASVWKALVNPEAIKEYMFGTTVVSDWQEGSPIRWKGEWKGKAYEDKGVILQLKPEKTLQYSHFSPLSGQPETPENYHTVTIQVAGEGGQTHVSLTQDNNPSEEARVESAKNWGQMLSALKTFVEK
jgi:uncharacterized protein YndB with AHSA1/START domain